MTVKNHGISDSAILCNPSVTAANNVETESLVPDACQLQTKDHFEHLALFIRDINGVCVIHDTLLIFANAVRCKIVRPVRLVR